MARASVLVVLLVLAGSLLTGSAGASQTATLNAGFEPNELGVSTTIVVGFWIKSPRGEVPSPLTGIELRLPAGVISATSTLGLATCEPTTLRERGLGGCSPNALMGRGNALVGVPVGPDIIYERIGLTMLMAPSADNHTAISFYAKGASPVIAQLLFPGFLLGDSGLFGTRLNATIPLISVLPGAPNAALVHMQLNIGPKGLTYYKRVDGTRVAYSPKGFGVPSKCPARGFSFAAVFAFADGSSTTATKTVRCPARTRRARAKRRGRSRKSSE
jgi:hypothetical protein